MAFRGRTAFFGGFALVCACSLTTSLDGLTGGDGGESATDGSSDSGNDSLVPKDAATDARSDSATGPESSAPFCASIHTFCADFDESTTVPAYDGVDDVDNDLSIDSTTSTSSPSSLSALLPVGGSNNARLTKDLTSGTHAIVAFDLKIEESHGNTILLSLFTPAADDAQNHFFYIETYDDAIQFTEAVTPADGGDTAFTGTSLGSMVEGAWTHFELDIDGTSGNVTSTMGASKESHTMMETFPNGNFQLYWGVSPNGLSPSVHTHYDDIAIDIE